VKADFLSDSRKRKFRQKLVAWYEADRRDLPWRASRDPYRVWLSEIMLQQTRVAAVIDHYHEFLRRFPTVEKLAAAREASVLAAWSGLGYYRRARMLHKAAKMIAREHDGRFPETEHELRAMPGIGRYTAAAIASIAFGETAAVVDGNVERVLQRVLGRPLAGERLWIAANHLLDAKRPGDFNQAMMELGAVVCTPRAPACLTCPVVELCATRGELAVLNKSAPQKKSQIHYALHCRHGRVLLAQRASNASLMAGMWELPEVASGAKAQSDERRSLAAPQEQILRFARNDNAFGNQVNSGRALLFTLRHSITVTDYTVHVWRGAARSKGKWVAKDRLARLPLTGLAGKILRKAGLMGTDRNSASGDTAPASVHII
jgi:A/G-specific adenine glycosylase